MRKNYVYFSEVIDLIESRKFYKGYALVDRRLLEDMFFKLQAQGLVSGRFETVNNQTNTQEGDGGNHARIGFRRSIAIYE